MTAAPLNSLPQLVAAPVSSPGVRPLQMRAPVSWHQLVPCSVATEQESAGQDPPVHAGAGGAGGGVWPVSEGAGAGIKVSRHHRYRPAVHCRHPVSRQAGQPPLVCLLVCGACAAGLLALRCLRRRATHTPQCEYLLARVSTAHVHWQARGAKEVGWRGPWGKTTDSVYPGRLPAHIFPLGAASPRVADASLQRRPPHTGQL